MSQSTALITGEITSTQTPEWLPFLGIPGAILMLIAVLALSALIIENDAPLDSARRWAEHRLRSIDRPRRRLHLRCQQGGPRSRTARDSREVASPVLSEIITRDYRLDSIDVSKDIDVDALCAPVSTRSPEVTGVVDGQQISFRVGVTDCHAEEPEARIIITETSGQAMNPEDLRKDQP